MCDWIVFMTKTHRSAKLKLQQSIWHNRNKDIKMRQRGWIILTKYTLPRNDYLEFYSIKDETLMWYHFVRGIRQTKTKWWMKPTEEICAFEEWENANDQSRAAENLEVSCNQMSDVREKSLPIIKTQPKTLLLLSFDGSVFGILNECSVLHFFPQSYENILWNCTSCLKRE